MSLNAVRIDKERYLVFVVRGDAKQKRLRLDLQSAGVRLQTDRAIIGCRCETARARQQ
jgi:hypothetical protein